MPLRCAVIGCGQVALAAHLPALRALADVQIEAACDVDAESVARAGRQFSIPRTYTDPARLLQEVAGLDFVVIATPGRTHFDIAMAALGRGLNLLVEKPVALEFEHVQQIARKAGDGKLRVWVGHTYRYRDPAQKAAEALAQGRLGELRQVNVVHRGGNLFDPHEPRWCWAELENKVLLYEHAIHLLDLAAWYAGPVKGIAGAQVVRDEERKVTRQVCAVAEHVSGVTTVVELQLFAPAPCSYVELQGSERRARLDFFPHHYREESGAVTPLQDLRQDAARTLNFGVEVLAGFLRRGVPRRALPHYRLYSAFLAALKGERQKTAADLESVLPTMEFLEQLGQWVYPREDAVAGVPVMRGR